MRDDDDEQDRNEYAEELHEIYLWVLYSRAEAAEFSDLLDEAADADKGFNDWMCYYGTDWLMELEEEGVEH